MTLPMTLPMTSPKPATLNSLTPGASRLYDAAGVRELDRVAIEEYAIPGITLMKRAAQACVDQLLQRWPAATRIALVCGSGNNAGDGFIIAGLLAAKGLQVEVCLVGKPPADDTDACQAYRFYLDSAARALPPLDIKSDINRDGLAAADVIVDALLGTGLDRDVQDAFAQIIRRVNQSRTPVLAVDIPSGLCADTGSCLGACIKASVTLTLVAPKLGLYTNDGPEYAGEIVYANLDLPEAIYARHDGWVERLAWEELPPALLRRHKNTHKKHQGHLLVVGGDLGMGGAVALVAEAALYVGAGLVSVATRPSNVASIIARRPEVMAYGLEQAQELLPLMARASAIVLGPGLGQGDWGRSVFDAVMQSDLPLLLDADGLNILAAIHPPRAEAAPADNQSVAQTRLASGKHVLTPHPGEASRLLGGTAVQADRKAAVTRLQALYSGVVLLKGAGTMIADDGRICLNPYGNPGMAVAGMGDLLSGVIGSLLAQGHSPWTAARLGAVLHSLAADQLKAAQGEAGLLATELLPVMRRLVNQQLTDT